VSDNLHRRGRPLTRKILPHFTLIVAEDLAVLGVEWPTALISSQVLSAGLRTDPDKSPDPVPSPRVKQAENCVDGMLGDEKNASSARSPSPDHLPLIAMLTLDSSVPVDIRVPADERLIPGEDVSIITNEDGTKSIDYLRGDAAQNFIDRVQKVRPTILHFRGALLLCSFLLTTLFRSFTFHYQGLDNPGLPPWLRRKCLSALCRVCGHRALLPKSLQIPLCYNRLEVPQYRGGYADVWMGYYQGRRVAAKVLRVYSTSDFNKVRRVCWLRFILSMYIFQLTMTRLDTSGSAKKQ